MDLTAFRPRLRKANFVLTLGRICPEKGTHLALDAAHRAGAYCVVGGEVFPYPAHQAYFEREVRWRTQRPGARYLGPLRLARKRRLLRAARCVLIPSLAPETSSLVAMEALASGTPVIAYASGALAEVVEHGVTGFLVRDVEDMAAAIARTEEIDPSRCREAAEQRFDQRRTIQRYFDMYATRSEVLTSRDALHEIEPEWQRLYDNCPDVTPFGSPQWLQSWWEAFGGAPLEVVAVRRRGELIGLLPLYRYGGRQYIVGNGRSDYLHCLALPHVQEMVVRHVWQHLDRCDLRDVPADDPLARYAPAEAVTEGDACYVLDPRALQWPAKLRKNLRLQRRKVEALGRAEWTDDADPLETLETLFDLHKARWHDRGEAGIFADRETRQFHRMAGPRLHAAGLLRIHAMRIDGVVRAALYCLSRNGRTHYYIGGFDPELAQHGVGSLLVQRAIEKAAERGDYRFDFLRGDEPYKRTWGAEPRYSRRIVLDRLEAERVVQLRADVA